MHVRVCPECGEEYRPEIVRCADCGGLLEDRHLEDEPVDEEVPAPLPMGAAPAWEPGSAVVIYSGAAAAEIEPLAERLGGTGIPFAVRTRFQAFDLLVRKEDLARARTELAPIVAGAEGATGTGREGGPGWTYDRCPACSSFLRAEARECPDCGLVVGEGPEGRPCPRCARPVGPEDAACPGCGASLEDV